MRVVVLARTVVNFAAGMAALDLDRRVPDRKLAAQAAFQIPDHVLGVAE